MKVCEFLAAAVYAKPDLTVPDLLILGVAWLRVTIDGDDPSSVARWIKSLADLSSDDSDLLQLRSKGLSIRAIADKTGLSKSTIARRLSQQAA